jgi:hypothetical protein
VVSIGFTVHIFPATDFSTLCARLKNSILIAHSLVGLSKIIFWLKENHTDVVFNELKGHSYENNENNLCPQCWPYALSKVRQYI